MLVTEYYHSISVTVRYIDIPIRQCVIEGYGVENLRKMGKIHGVKTAFCVMKVSGWNQAQRYM
jgi:hypothetical protein